jgi:hypothetical protein
MLHHNLAAASFIKDFIALLKQKIGRVQSTVSGSAVPKDAPIAMHVFALSSMVVTGKSPSVLHSIKATATYGKDLQLN